MRIGKTTVEDNGYSMYEDIEWTEEEKDTGVVIDDKLAFSDHLAEKINKANKIVGLIRRTFVHLEPEIFKILFTALVRPHLEYANQVWCPHLVKDIAAVENVQGRATKLLPHLKDLSYEKTLRTLNVPTLAYRKSWWPNWNIHDFVVNMIVNAQRDYSRCGKTPSLGEVLRRYSSLEHSLTSENILFPSEWTIGMICQSGLWVLTQWHFLNQG